MTLYFPSVQFSSAQALSRVRLFATPWIAARQASLSITNSQNLLKLMPVESVMPSSHLIHCRPLLLLPTVPPSIRVFSNESTFLQGLPISCLLKNYPYPEHRLLYFSFSIFHVVSLTRLWVELVLTLSIMVPVPSKHECNKYWSKNE